MARYVAVFDVGKTNKKVVIFDEQMQQIEAAYQEFPADESGPEHIEQTEAATAWLLEQLGRFATSFDIGAIGITTHGATVTCVADDGSPALSTIAYTTDPGQDFADASFAALGGDSRSLHREFATPHLGSLVNAGLGARYVKERHPEAWAKTRWLLPYPQYFAYVLTGVAGTEPTMLGCHSYLYDFQTSDYSRAVDAFGLRDKLPERIQPSGTVIGCVSDSIRQCTGLPADCKVILGVHDSNASLVPYLMQADGHFILNSTGTWCVAMRPSDAVSFTEDQLDLGVFYNCSVFGSPVKTAIFMGGQERLDWLTVMERRHPDWALPDYDEAAYNDVLDGCSDFILPGVMPGTGPFPRSVSRLVSGDTETTLAAINDGAAPFGLQSPVRDYALLGCSLAIQTAELLANLDLEDGMQIFIEGGFRHNVGYQKVLSALCPQARIVLSSLKEATAFGSGLLALAALKGCALDDLKSSVQIETTPVEPATFPGLAAYRERFLTLARS